MLPKLNVIIGADTKGFNRGITSAQKRMQAFTKSVNRMAIAAKIALAVAAVSGFKFAKDLDTALAETSTLIEGTVEQMDAIKDAAIRMAREFGGSSAEQVKAFYQTISSGINDVTEATEFMQTANLLAQGGVTNIFSAVDVLTSVMNAYADSNLTASRASDILFSGVVAGKTTINELTSALGRVAPMASKMGIGLADVTAAVATLTKGGMSTAESVTGLRGVLRAILRPSESAKKAAKDLGLEFTVLQLKTVGLVKFLDDVNTATGGTASNLSKLFIDTEGLIGVMALAADGGESFKQVFDSVTNSLGATQIAADKIAKALSTRLKVEVTKLRELMTAFGGVLLKVVVPALEWLNRRLDNLVLDLKIMSVLVEHLPAIFAEAFGRMGDSGKILSNKLKIVWTSINRGFLGMILDIQDKWGTFLRMLRTGVDKIPGMSALGKQLQVAYHAADVAFGDTSRALEALSNDTASLTEENDRLTASNEGQMKSVRAMLEAVNKLTDNYAKAAAIKEILRNIKLGGTDETNDIIELGEKVKKELTKIQERMQDAADTIQSSMTNAFMSMVDGTKTVKDAFRDMAKSIIAKLFEILVVQRLVGSFSASTGAGSGIVGLIMKGISSFEGGGFTGNGPRTGGLDGRGGKLAIVHPQETIIDHTKAANNNGGIGGTTIVNQTINVSAGVSQTVRAEMISLLPLFKQETIAAVSDSNRRAVRA